MIWYPSLDDVYRFHNIQIFLYGGSTGVRDEGLVESALLTPQQTFAGQDLYATISDKAAALWHGFVCNHAFVDGNKRIGLMVTSVFLIANGYEMDFADDEVEDITMKLAQSDMSRQQLIDIMSDHVRLRWGHSSGASKEVDDFLL
ncbi:MAG: type II toxin-antitoxin system death-on-curing family toxin [Armatimonadetes bacterium]|nr:type II toxin-antitoxin system death-on-curing family toxin [Armatimonadota bacterium]